MKTTSIYAALALTLVSQNSSAQWVPTDYYTGGGSSQYPFSPVNAFAVNGSLLFAATDTAGVLRTANNGDSWVQVNNGLPTFPWLPGVPVPSLVVGGSDLYAGSGDLKYGQGGYQGSGTVSRTTNNGDSWSTSTVGPHGTGLVTSLAARGFVFAGTQLNGVFRSSDQGITWEQGTPGPTWSHPTLSLLASSQKLFAGTSAEGVLVSTDNGTTWTQCFSSPSNIWALARAGSVLLAGAYDGGIMRSTDEGNTWHHITAGLPTQSLTCLAASGQIAFCGVHHSWHPAGYQYGVGASIDSGLTWWVVNEGFPQFPSDVWEISALAIKDTFLFAGVTLYSGRQLGIWRRSIPEIVRLITSVEEPRNGVPLSFGLQQNYPNPFNPSTTIKYELPKSSLVRLSLFDMLGREVSELVNERKAAGIHEVRFDGSGLASGVYFYRLTAGDFVQTRKLVLMK